MKNLVGNLLLLGFSFAIVFVIGEVASRYITPISPGPSILDLDGNKQKISYIEPDKSFRILTPDFDAVTTITKDGYRGPEAEGTPDVVFVGDSFTYAQGVENHQTFSAIYCKTANLNCANLGVPGASTLYEVDRLEYFLKEKHWRPSMVNFFFFTGNDFGDNLDASSKRKQGLPYEPVELHPLEEEADKGAIESIIDFGLKHSNLLRVAYFKVLPMVRGSEDESEDTLKEALSITKAEFDRLSKLSTAYGFNYKVYVFYPEPEITHDVYQALSKKLQAHSSVPLTHLGDLFKEDTKDYFFPADGHLSLKGNQKLAEFLLTH